jgi:hypothetical protein
MSIASISSSAAAAAQATDNSAKVQLERGTKASAADISATEVRLEATAEDDNKAVAVGSLGSTLDVYL